MQLALRESLLAEGQVVVEGRLEGGGSFEEKGQHCLFVIPTNYIRRPSTSLESREGEGVAWIDDGGIIQARVR